MALIDDLNIIMRASMRSISILIAAQKNTTNLDPNGEVPADTEITLTQAQRDSVAQKIGPLLAVIKTRAAGLPGPP